MSDSPPAEFKYVWHSRFEAVAASPRVLSQHLFILAGPSGIGKTSVAVALAELFDNCRPLRNFTTRPRRAADPPRHFSYLTDSAFDTCLNNGSFVLARTSPPPKYGYLLDDLNAIIRNDQLGFFMFRNAGVAYLAQVLPPIPVIFLEGDARNAAIRSLNSVVRQSEAGAQSAIVANRRLHDHLSQIGWPCLILENEYRGLNELRSLAQSVMAFVVQSC